MWYVVKKVAGDVCTLTLGVLGVVLAGLFWLGAALLGVVLSALPWVLVLLVAVWLIKTFFMN